MKQLLIIWTAICMLPHVSCGQASSLNRPFEPVVMKGTELGAYIGQSPSSIVAFRYLQSSWQQVPVQVDEMALLDIVTPYGPYAAEKGFPPPTGVKELFYTDPKTYTGADPDPTLDGDDELVFMVADAGERFSGATWPAGVVAGTGQEVSITDPLGGKGYVYLFLQDGSLQQDAGKSYVSYFFQLANGGTYPQDFKFLNARNNENSNVNTSNYSWHFAAEWISDELKITTGGAPNTDILDRHKNFFANNNCIRSENTFSDGDNAFIINKSGPVRAIRSYMGANSGPLTQRTHLFYQGRQDIITHLRVHNIASIYDAFDYNSNINGAKYRNNLNTAGVVINGTKDAITTGDINWELVSGSKGSVVILLRRATDLAASEATFTSYYDDNKTKPASNCTGDGQAWGTSGVGVLFSGGNVCTEPLKSSCTTEWFRKLAMRRVIYFEAPNVGMEVATRYNDQLNNTLLLSVSALSSGEVVPASISSAKNLMIEGAFSQEVKVVPNPAKGRCTVVYQAVENAAGVLRLIDAAGREVWKRSAVLFKGRNTWDVDMSNLGAGIYFIQVNTGKASAITRVVAE